MTSALAFKAIPDEKIRVCGCCLSTGNLLNMQEEWTGETKSYFDVMNICYAKILDESQPFGDHLICKNCIDRLKSAYKFKFQIIDAQETLLEYYKIRVDVSKLHKKTCQDPLIYFKASKQSRVQNDTFYDNDCKSEIIYDALEETQDENTNRRTDSKKASVNVVLQEAKLEDDIILKQEQIDTDDDSNMAPEAMDETYIENDHLIAKSSNTSNRTTLNEIVKISQVPKVREKLLLKVRDTTILSSHNQNKLECKICQKKFCNSKLLSMHAREHFKGIKCEICSKTFTTKQRLDLHMKLHSKGPFRCKDCPKVYATIRRLKHHSDYSHERVSKHVCRLCKARFLHYYGQQKHMRDVHGVAGKHPCKQCGKLYMTTASLTTHIRNSHMIRKRIHDCKVCNASFHAKNTLNRHMTVHTGKKAFICDVCGKTFARSNNLIQHARIHDDVKAYICSECGHGFNQKCSLRNHLKIHEK